MPKYYYVPREGVEGERANPGSQDRVALGDEEAGGATSSSGGRPYTSSHNFLVRTLYYLCILMRRLYHLSTSWSVLCIISLSLCTDLQFALLFLPACGQQQVLNYLLICLITVCYVLLCSL